MQIKSNLVCVYTKLLFGILTLKWGELLDKKRMGAKSKIVTDPNGSYTGQPVDRYEKPAQDADDL